MPDPSATTHLRRLLAQRLESLQFAGVEQLPRGVSLPLPAVTEATETANSGPSPANRSPANPPQPTPDATTPAAAAEPPLEDAAEASPTPAISSSSAQAEPAEQLQVLQQQVSQCTRCPELVESRTQTVFGVGNVRPRLCFFGEAPGRDEDQQGEPFVGAAGQLLNKIIQAMTLERSDVYILNVLKCRPPQNRNPEPDEVSNCRPYFERQLEILQPEFICCLGAYAARTLLDTELSVGKLRGRFHDYGAARVLVTYHPAYLLRNESAKRSTWEDMQMLMAEMGLKRG